jgi:threonyl-tRNA synthetase
LLLNRIRRLSEAYGYQEVRTPLLWKADLYKTSGHHDHYRGNMFWFSKMESISEPDKVIQAEQQEHYNLKPMNCPGHMEIFRSRRWSYRDLPVRYAEYSPLHRNEVSGTVLSKLENLYFESLSQRKRI